MVNSEYLKFRFSACASPAKGTSFSASLHLSSSAEVNFWGYVLLLSVAQFRVRSNTRWSMNCFPDNLPFSQVLVFYINVQNC